MAATKLGIRHKAIILLIAVLVACIKCSYVYAANHHLKNKLSIAKVTHPEIDSIGAIWDIEQDKHGFLWFGGENGLVRYDGYDTKIYEANPDLPGSLSSSFVMAMLIDQQQRLWVATTGGLNLYLPETDTFKSFSKDPQKSIDLSNKSVRAIIQSRDGLIWLGTESHGVINFDPQSLNGEHYVHHPNQADSLASNKIRSLLEDRDGLIWIGTEGNGLSALNRQTGLFQHYNYTQPGEAESVDNNVYTLLEDAQGSIWIGTLSGGIIMLNAKRDHFTRFLINDNNGSLSNANDIRDLKQDKDGNIWIATAGGGLNILDSSTNKISQLLHSPGGRTQLTSNKIRTLFNDAYGDWWLGHFPSGLSKVSFRNHAFLNYQNVPGDESSLSDNGVLSFAEDVNGNLWIGTENGLNLLDRSKNSITRFVNYSGDKKSIPSAAILTLTPADDEHLWVGTYASGMGKFNIKTHQYQPLDLGKASREPLKERVWRILASEDNTLWIGTEGNGLICYNLVTGKTQSFRHDPGNPQSISSDFVTGLHMDSNNKLWVTTATQLNLMDRRAGTFERFETIQTKKKESKEYFSWSVFESSSGQIWLGSNGLGLNRLDQELNGLTSFRKVDGLPSNSVIGILEDDNGHLWLSTLKGLSMFNPTDQTFTNYSTAHGLPGDVFNRPASLKTKSGELVFGSSKGFTLFRPSDIKEDPLPLNVVLTDFKLFNESVSLKDPKSPLSKPIKYTDSITLRHNQFVFSIDFASPNYKHSNILQYSYKLKGFEDEWSVPSTQRLVRYTNLYPGTYVFSVRAVTSQGLASDSSRDLKIVILPPWWQAWWAYSLLASILFLSTFFYFISQRNKIIEEQEINKRLRDSESSLELKVLERTKELEKLNDRLRHLSNTDPLTGLYNRRFFYDQYEKACRTCLRNKLDLSVIVMDIDHFKSVNDSLGHHAGDLVLVAVSKTLSGHFLRSTDVLARMGGEEFAVALLDTNLENTLKVAESLRIAIESQPLQIESTVISVTISIGVSTISSSDMEGLSVDAMEDLIKKADLALYESKNCGRNQVTHFEFQPT